MLSFASLVSSTPATYTLVFVIQKVIMAVFAGMAAGAVIVVVLAMRHPVLAEATGPVSAPVKSNALKPSALGTALAIAQAVATARLPQAEIGSLAARSLVTVAAYDAADRPLRQSAGFVYSSSGVVVTTYRAIRGASSVVVETPAGRELNVISIAGYSPSSDLAVLTVLEGNLPAIENGSAEAVQDGDRLTVSEPDHSSAPSVVRGRRAISGIDLIQMEIAGNPGTPVLNATGKLVAVSNIRQVDGNLAAVAVPVRYVSDLLAAPRNLSFDQVLRESQPR